MVPLAPPQMEMTSALRANEASKKINKPMVVGARNLSGRRHKYGDVRCAAFDLGLGARRAHPPKWGCNRRATTPQAKSRATLRAAVLFGAGFVARSLQTHGGYARRSRLACAKNALPRTSPYLCLRPLRDMNFSFYARHSCGSQPWSKHFASHNRKEPSASSPQPSISPRLAYDDQGCWSVCPAALDGRCAPKKTLEIFSRKGEIQLLHCREQKKPSSLCGLCGCEFLCLAVP